MPATFGACVTLYLLCKMERTHAATSPKMQPKGGCYLKHCCPCAHAHPGVLQDTCRQPQSCSRMPTTSSQHSTVQACQLLPNFCQPETGVHTWLGLAVMIAWSDVAPELVTPWLAAAHAAVLMGGGVRAVDRRAVAACCIQPMMAAVSPPASRQYASGWKVQPVIGRASSWQAQKPGSSFRAQIAETAHLQAQRGDQIQCPGPVQRQTCWLVLN